CTGVRIKTIEWDRKTKRAVKDAAPFVTVHRRDGKVGGLDYNNLAFREIVVFTPSRLIVSKVELNRADESFLAQETEIISIDGKNLVIEKSRGEPTQDGSYKYFRSTLVRQ